MIRVMLVLACVLSLVAAAEAPPADAPTLRATAKACHARYQQANDVAEECRAIVCYFSASLLATQNTVEARQDFAAATDLVKALTKDVADWRKRDPAGADRVDRVQSLAQQHQIKLLTALIDAGRDDEVRPSADGSTKLPIGSGGGGQGTLHQNDRLNGVDR